METWIPFRILDAFLHDEQTDHLVIKAHEIFEESMRTLLCDRWENALIPQLLCVLQCKSRHRASFFKIEQMN